MTTGQLADMFCKAWGEGIGWKNISVDGPHEANFLKLDCAKIKSRLGWQPRWHIEEALRETVAWAKAWQQGEDIAETMEKQITQFLTMKRTEKLDKGKYTFIGGNYAL